MTLLNRTTDNFRQKIIFFVIITIILSSSFLADFYLRNTLFYLIQQVYFWPIVLSLILLLISDRKILAVRFSRYSVILFLIILIGLFFRLYKVHALPLNHDEAHTTLRTLFLFKDKNFISYAGIPIAFLGGKVPSLFPLLVSVAARWSKNPEIIVRLPSMVVGLFTIWLIYRFVKEFSQRKTALAAAFFLALLPWHIIQSRVGVNAILTPCFGVLFFLLFTKAIKNKSYKYFYLSFFVLGISTFWTDTASQIFVILAIICCITFIRELSWLRTIDIVNCVLLFIIPLYPFLVTWDKSNFVQSQYYYSIFSQHNNLFSFITNMGFRLRDVFKLLFLAKDPFLLFAPGFKGPLIQFFLLLPLAFGILYIRKNRILARVISIWLIGGIFFSVCFIRHVEDRYFIAIAPAISILIAYGIVINKSKKNIFLSASAAIIGLGIYGSNYFSYLNRIPLESLKVYSYGSSQVAMFLSKEESFTSPNTKAVVEWRMSPAEFYFTLAKANNEGSSKTNYLDKFIAYWGGDLPRSQDIIFYCLWSPESREYDWDAFNCQLYKKFRLLYPEKSPIKIIYYPNGNKVIEIFKIEQ